MTTNPYIDFDNDPVGNWPREDRKILEALDACTNLQLCGTGDRPFREQLNRMIGGLKFELRDRGHEV